jgi:hypothetical protein
MKCRLIKIESLSGRKASVYSVSLGREVETLLEKFVRENQNLYLSETKDILGHHTTD